MLILLPPSETKRTGGSGVFDPSQLRDAVHLGEARGVVRSALEEVSADEDRAAKTLKLGVKNRSEIGHNLRLEDSGVLPAIERYTGVLYDALDVETLDSGARSWLDAHVLVQSALFGLIGAGDHIPAYRLSASSRLPGLEQPLKRLWAAAHANGSLRDTALVLDLRSKDYAALASVAGPACLSLQVVQRGADGQVRALNHFNKAAKGDLVRRLARSAAKLTSVADLLAWAEAHDLELTVDQTAGTATLVTDLGAPSAQAS